MVIQMTKVDLVTGILGAGKTTFIRKYVQYLNRQGLKTAVLLNDYGAVNIDMVMLKDLKGPMCDVSMVVGGADADCHKRRFKTQLIALGMQHFDRVIIEPSGIFDMDEYFDTLYESPLDRWFEKGTVITIADSDAGSELSDEMMFMLGSECSCCGSLVISKLSEIPDHDTVKMVTDRINTALEFIGCRRRFAPEEAVAKPWDSLTDDDFAAIASSSYRAESYVKLFNRDTVKSSVHYFMHISVPETSVRSMTEDIMNDPECGKIFRIKGSLPAENGRWLRINAMPSAVTVTPATDGQAVLIVIGDSLNPEKISSYISSLNTDPEYVFI